MKLSLVFVIVVLFGSAVGLQWRLWLAEQGGVLSNRNLEAKIVQQEKVNVALMVENERLTAEVSNLKRDLSVIEARARFDLGMIRDGETFYRLVEEM